MFISKISWQYKYKCIEITVHADSKCMYLVFHPVHVKHRKLVIVSHLVWTFQIKKTVCLNRCTCIYNIMVYSMTCPLPFSSDLHISKYVWFEDVYCNRLLILPCSNTRNKLWVRRISNVTEHFQCTLDFFDVPIRCRLTLSYMIH